MHRCWATLPCLLALLTAPAQAGTVSVCTPNIEYFCDSFGGCKSGAGVTGVRVDWVSRTYSRCDKDSSCLTFDAQIEQKDPMIITVFVPSIKVHTDISFNGSYYIEHYTNVLGVFLTIGTCKM